MTVVTIAIVSAAAAVIVLLALTLSLTRQVRRLGSEVRGLTQVEDANVTGRARAIVAVAPCGAHRDEGTAVITSVPIGPAEAGPDLHMTRVASVALAGPLIKVAAFSHGVRRALDEETRMRIAYAFRKELRRQRRLRRRRAATAGPPRKEGWRP